MGEQTGFEAVQFVEPMPAPGTPYRGPEETHLGTFPTEAEAVRIAREAWLAHRRDRPNEVAWWIVRVPGEELARWIADSRSPIERALDLRTKQLVEVPR